MEKLSRFCETDNSVKARTFSFGHVSAIDSTDGIVEKMKSLSAVHYLALWTYFTVFASMAEAPTQVDKRMEENQFYRIIGLHPLTFPESPSFANNHPGDETVRAFKAIHTLETYEFTQNASTAAKLEKSPVRSPQGQFGPVDVSVDLSLASKNSCKLINESIYKTEAKTITFFSKEFHEERASFTGNSQILDIQNSSLRGAVSNAEDLSEIITRINQSNHGPDSPNIISNSMKLHFFMNTSESGIKYEPNQDYLILRCNFLIKNSSTTAEITKSEGVLRKEPPKKVSITIRLQGPYGEFNLRSIVEDMDRFVRPSYCSSKIPFFYSLVITGDLKTNSTFVIFITFNYILSTCSLVLIFITAKLSHQWRQRRSNIILINFAMSIFSQIVLHFISDFTETDEGLCTVVTVLCHYFTLVQFFWTSTIAYMQYRRYVQVFEEKDSYFLIKLVLFTWITPVLVISASLILVFSMPEDTKKTCDDKFKVCSLINTYLLKYSVSLPLLITLLINFVFFILIFRHLLRRKLEFDQKSSALVEVKLAFVLFFLLDLNLIVAIIADMFSVDILAMIFVTSHSLQGVLLFVVFVIRNKSSRKMYVRWIKIMLDRIAFYIC